MEAAFRDADQLPIYRNSCDSTGGKSKISGLGEPIPESFLVVKGPSLHIFYGRSAVLRFFWFVTIVDLILVGTRFFLGVLHRSFVRPIASLAIPSCIRSRFGESSDACRRHGNLRFATAPCAWLVSIRLTSWSIAVRYPKSTGLFRLSRHTGVLNLHDSRPMQPDLDHSIVVCFFSCWICSLF